jgi:hypothetical protein
MACLGGVASVADECTNQREMTVTESDARTAGFSAPRRTVGTIKAREMNTTCNLVLMVLATVNSLKLVRHDSRIG